MCNGLAWHRRRSSTAPRVQDGRVVISRVQCAVGNDDRVRPATAARRRAEGLVELPVRECLPALRRRQYFGVLSAHLVVGRGVARCNSRGRGVGDERGEGCAAFGPQPGDQRPEKFCSRESWPDRAEIPRGWREKGDAGRWSSRRRVVTPGGKFARCGSFSSPIETLFELFPKTRQASRQESVNILFLSHERTKTCGIIADKGLGRAAMVRVSIGRPIVTLLERLGSPSC